MNKFYNSLLASNAFKITKAFFVVLLLTFISKTSQSQVTVSATVGNTLRSYSTLGDAFNAINNGVHGGVIVISITANTNEGSNPATLNSNAADPAAYQSVTIRPTVDGVIIRGNPAQGFGVVQLNGADSVTFDGDNPNTGGINRNLTIENISATTVSFSSVIRIATSLATNTATDITIKNCNLNGNITNANVSGYTFSQSDNTFGIYAGGLGGSAQDLPPTAITSTSGDFALDGTTIANLVISNNSINQCARGISFLGEVSSVSNLLTISSNVIGASGTNPATTVYSKGISIRGTDAMTISGNTIRNVQQYQNQNVIGIELFSAIGTGAVAITNNNISGIVNNGTASDARGIAITNIGAPYTIINNTISSLESNGFGVTSGILINSTTAVGLLEKNTISGIFAKGSGGAAGINLSSAPNAMTVQNNFIYDIKNSVGTTFSSVLRGASGILINSGSNHKIYHNSINLYNVSTATVSTFSACISIAQNTFTGIDIRNNILSNTVTGGSASDANVCLFMPFAALSSMNLTLNNNGYYTGTTAGKSGIAFAGTNTYNAANFYIVADFDANVTTPATNWRSFSTSLGVANNDNSSIAISTGNPFVSNTDLHVPNGASQSALESGGAVVGVTQDIDNQSRPGPAGSVNGGGTLPDIGADEFDRNVLDKFPPVITFTPPVTCGIGPRLLTATITDATGVPTSGIGLPVLYWRIVGSPSYTAQTATWISGSQYQFTIDPSSTAGLGQSVEYYIVAQDNVIPANVTSNPSIGATGYTTSPPAVSTPPTTTFSYTVINALAGTYTVGATGNYPTLTAAINDYNVSCITGSVVFNLIDANYSTNETFPIIINPNGSASPTNTLTIKPATGVNALITGNNGTALLKLNGAKYVILDGSNNGTSSRNLTFNNTNANSTAAVIWMGSASASIASSNNTIRNINITGSGSSTTLFGIISGSATTLGNFSDASNQNNTITNCQIKSTQYGIAIAGNTISPDVNWIINNNNIGSTVSTDKIGFRGISLQNISGFTLSGDTIAGVSIPTGSSTASGIILLGGVTNGNIFNNRISDVKQLSSGGWTANGLMLSTSTGANINVYNNFIWDIAAFGFSSTSSFNGYGIHITTGSGYNIYYNSISLSTNQSVSSGITAAINITSGVTSPNSINLRNNIFSNSQTVGTRYAIISGAAASVYSNINYNDYFSSGTNLGFLTSPRANLGAWQVATGKDANSVNVIPSFTSVSDLHLLNTSLLNALGTNIASYTNDIDGNARNLTTPDIGADEFNGVVCTNPVTGGTAASNISVVCNSTAVSLSATGYSIGENIAYQWQVSPDGVGSWTDISGQTNPLSGNTGVISVPRYFRLRVICSSGTPGFSTVVFVNVSNPAVTPGPNVTRCGPGSVTLTATGSASTNINWYDASGNLVSVGSPFVTPIINTIGVTTFFVSAETNPVIPQNTTVNNYKFFATTGGSLDPMTGSTTVIGSNVDDIPVSGPSNIGFNFNYNGVDYTQFSVSPDGWILMGGATATSQFTNNVTSATNTPKIYPFWDDVATGVDGNVKFVVTGTAPNRILKVQWFVTIPRATTGSANSTFQAWLYESSNKIEFRYGSMGPSTTMSASVGLTGSSTIFQSLTVSSATTSNSVANNANSTLPASGTLYSYYPPTCESAQTPVTVTVTAPPAISASATSTTICDGQSTTLNVSSANPGYTYQWNPGALSGASVSVSPSVLTTYTVTATDGVSGCSNIATVTINVNPSPSPVVKSNDTTICVGGSATLSASSAVLTNVTNYNFTTSTGAALDPMTGATTVLTSSNDDDPTASPINIGFTFNFDVSSFTQFSVSPDGWILLGGATANSQFNNSVTSTLNTPKIYPYWDDLATGSDGSVKYVVTGTAPNRILKVEWQVLNPRFPLTGASNSTFQAWLYETTGLIEFRYGSMNANTNSASVGLTVSNINFQSVTISTNTTSNSVPNDGNTGQPASGRMYTFIRPSATITWTPTATLSSSTGSPVTATPITTTTYIATATNTIGCSRTDSIKVTVITAPSVSIVANPNPACAGANVTFTATPVFGGTTPTYQWQISTDGGFTWLNQGAASTSPTLNISTLSNGNQIRVIMGYNNICGSGTATSNAITMTITPLAPASVTIAASPSGPICAGTSVTFTPTPTNGGATPSYEWFIGAVSQGVSPTFTSAALTNGQVVSVRMTSSLTCVSGSPATSAGITMVVNPNLTASVNIAASPSGAICAGTSVTFTPTPTNGGLTPSYEWFIGAVSQGVSATFTTTALINGQNVTAQMTTSQVCTTPIPVTSNTITAIVNSGLVASVAITSVPSGPVCAGTNVCYNATPVNGGTPTYQWFVNGSPVGTNSSSYCYVPLQGDVVNVQMTTSLACAAPSPVTSNNISLTVLAKPVLAPTANCTTILSSGQTAIISANATPGAGAINASTGYSWYNPTVIGGQTSSTLSVSAAGSFTVKVTDANGCSDSTIVPVTITVSSAPLAAGIYSIPGTGCSGFDRISSAITYINANGISGSGGVIFNIAGSHTETAPTGGYRITRNGTATNQIIFRGISGSPVITASSSHSSGSINDAVFKIVGADYISIRGLTIQENPLAPTIAVASNNQTEWGIALLQASVTDGPQFDSIAGNTISLNRNYTNSAGIYSNSGHGENTPTIASLITTAAGANSNNKFFSNTISNVNFGMAIIGSSSNGFFDTGNEIGGTALGNTITNWGGNAVTSAYSNFNASAVMGILAKDQVNENVIANSLTSASLSGVAGVGVNTRGIWKTYSTTPITGTIITSITNNNVRLTGNYTSAGAYEFNAIRTDVLNLATATLNINNNTVENTTIAAGGTPTTVLINNTSIPGTLNINSNIVRASTSSATLGTITAISNSGAAGTLSLNSNEVKGLTVSSALVCITSGVTTGTQSINSNLIGETGPDVISSSAGAVTGISSTGLTTPTKTCNSNVIKSITGIAAVTPITVTGGTTSATVNSNTINTMVAGANSSSIVLGGTATTFITANTNTINGFNSSGFIRGIDVTATGTNNIVINGNTITNFTSTSGNTITVGISLNAPASITNNNINNLTINAGTPSSGTVAGVYISNAGTFTISGNTINNLLSNNITGNGVTQGLVNGIYMVAGTNVTISKNRIYNLAFNGAASATTITHGIHLGIVPTTVTLTNNFISDLRNPQSGSTDGVRGIGISAATALTTVNIYYNTIYLNATSNQTNFGSSGIFHTSSGTATSAALTLRNNIIVNNSVSNGTGFSIVLRRNAATNANYLSASNNNDFFGAVLYAEGATNYTTLSAMKTYLVSPREASSINSLPQFRDLASNPMDLRLKLDLNCAFDGFGNNSVILIPDDFEGETRSTSNPFITDIGADEFAGTGAGIGVWKGVNSDWMDINNWCGEIPASTTNVTIPSGSPFYPIITTNAPTAQNITIAAGASVTINAGGRLSVTGNMLNSGTLTNNGRINLNNTGTDQDFPGNAGTVSAMDTLEINKSAGTALNLNKSITIGKALLPNTGKINFNSFNITIASDINGTARIGTVGTTDAFNYNSTGRFVIERYINTGVVGSQHSKSWQLLAAPAFGQTLRNAWQEAGSPLNSSPAGLGTILVSDRTSALANGFDIQTSSGGTSIKVYNPATDTYTMVANTNVEIANPNGYMTFVRGDRNVTTSVAAPNPTKLRITGRVYAPGTDAPASVAVGNNLFQSVGNPYASAINFGSITKSAFIQDLFYVWDPTLNSSTGLGGWQTIIFSGGNYVPLIGGTPYYPVGVPVSIQSGQGFFVKTFGGTGTLTFTEAAKTGGSTILLRTPNMIAGITTKLYNQSGLITDGNLVRFSDRYSNEIDALDAPKRINGGENFGIISSRVSLAMEARASVTDADTIHYQMSNLRQQRYRLIFAPENMDRGVRAFLEDRFTNVKTPVSIHDTTFYEFSVTSNIASSASDRFILVFKTVPVPPATITNVTASKEDMDVMVKWSIENQGTIVKYDVERSVDGVNFTRIGTVNSRIISSGNYELLDDQPFAGDNYYRIKLINRANEGRYSNTVKVTFEVPSSITIFPNPVKEDATIQVTFENKPAGIYDVTIWDASGKNILNQRINHLGGTVKYPVSFDRSVAHGNYVLKVTDAQKVKTNFKFIY